MRANDDVALPLLPAGPATERPISVAIVAMGGQGGGVLTDWIVRLAEGQGWVAQSTSVPGVAQRTGATIYYVECMRAAADGRRPILAQMPTPGDVDVVLAAEFMEAGRSILRGLVTPGRTTLIASSHRTLAISEKMRPGEGIADGGAVDEAIGVAAKRRIVFDMDAVARANGSVVSAALFGGLAASGELPFPREAFEAVIRESGKGVAASLAAFDEAHRRTLAAAPVATAPAREESEASAGLPPVPDRLADPRADRLLQRLRREVPGEAWPMAFAGLVKVVDHQDEAYGEEYLDLLAEAARHDGEAGGAAKGFAFTVATAKHLANAMCYDDVFRVADLKVRRARRERVAAEVGLRDGQILTTTEFFHPRREEVLACLPPSLALPLGRHAGLGAWLDRRFEKGRRVETYSLGGFLVLWGLAGLGRWRRHTLRHRDEVAHRDAWLAACREILPKNYDLACRMVGVRRLVKGYSDTHARGLSKFDAVTTILRRIAERPDAVRWADLLMKAAIRDASGDELVGVTRTIESFLPPAASA